MNIEQQCIQTYQEVKHLKTTGDILGIPWQTVYVHLRNNGVAVTGDKERYGSEADRFAARSEKEFQILVPMAQPQNRFKFQAKFDFLINGLKVDLKAARPKSYTKGGCCRWSFSLKKQVFEADFFVCLAFCKDEYIKHCLLIPADIAKGYSSISLSPTGTRWWEYEVEPSDLVAFFEGVKH